MVFSLPWWVAAAGLSLGAYLVLRIEPSLALASTVVVANTLALGATVLASWIVRTRGGGVGWGIGLLFGLFVAGVSRGVGAGSRVAEPWVTESRSVDAVWLDFQVVGASTPGPSCLVAAELIGGGRREVVLAVPPGACPLAEGESFRARLPPDPPRWPGDPPRSSSRPIVLDFVGPRHGTRSSYWAAVASLRQRAWDLSRGDGSRAFLAASLLGLRSALSSEERRSLRSAGLGHLIAVSGLHVGLAALLVQRGLVAMLLRIRAPIAWGVMLSWFPTVAYIGLTGAAAPAVRAGIMVLLTSLGQVVGRPVHGLHTLIVAATLMLAVVPEWIVDPGFQLSMVAMGAIVMAPPGVALVEQTWRVSWAILPFSIAHFQDANVYGVLANLLALPVFTLWIAPIGALGWILTPIWGTAALEPASWGAAAILRVAEVLSAWPQVGLPALALGCAVAWSVRFAWGRLAEVPRAWPSSWALVATGTAAFWVSRPTPPVDPDTWWAVGRAERPTVVTLDELGRACIDEPVGAGGAGRLAALLAAMGARSVGSVTSQKSGPHLDALVHRLAQETRWEPASVPCTRPDRELVTQAMRACSRRHGGASVAASGSTLSPIYQCYEQDDWSSVRISSVQGWTHESRPRRTRPTAD